MVVGEAKRTNIMDGIENTGDVRLHDHRLRLKQRFDIVRKLGQGTYGKVQLGINKKTGQEVAIKTIKKCKIESEADLVRIRREVQIMSSVRHPNIVHIYEVFENSEKMILVMEYCSGGELYDYLSQKKVLEEEEARRLFRQIATAVYYCHIHKICHRDLKLENVLLDDTGSAKIADFGLSNVFKETSLLSTFCGSPLYASPEIVKGTPYIGPEVDCWSLGVLLYTLVYGAMPFDGSNFKRLVRQISNGDYYEPKNPSTASPLIRDMLTVDPLKRADIAYICDHPWVNSGCSTSCLEVAEALAAETPVRLDLLLSLAPPLAAPAHCNSVVVPSEAQHGPEESCTDLTSSTSMPVEPSNSAEKRILELVAEGGEDAIKPSPTRTIVSANDNKRKLELAMSASGLQRKKEKVASSANIALLPSALPEEGSLDLPPAEEQLSIEPQQPCLKSSATITIAPAPIELAKDATIEISKRIHKEDEAKDIKPHVTVKKKATSLKDEEKFSPEKQEESKLDEPKQSSVATATDKLTSLTLTQQTPAPAPVKPKKLSIGGHVGSFKEQFERRASLTAAPEIKRNVSKPILSKIAKPKAQSEDRDLSSKSEDNGTVRLQQIGIEPSQTPVEEMREVHSGGVKKTESEPMHNTPQIDPSVSLQDARRSLQNSMAKLVEEKAGEENRRRAARDIISSAIRTGKPPVPYGRSSSAGVTSLSSPPGTPPAAPPSASATAPRLFRTEAHHRVDDHRNRGVSVERIIPIHMSSEEGSTPPQKSVQPVTSPVTPPSAPRQYTPLRRLASTESPISETCSSPGEPIKKSAREFIIPIAVEGKGYVTPRQRSLEPESSHSAHAPRLARPLKPRRISSLVSGGESEEEDDTHMHRLRSTRAARAESVSSGEEDEEDEGFHLLTAENLFSTLLHRVRALTQRLNGEEGPGFPQHPQSLFNNLHQSPFFNSPHLPRRHLVTHKFVESKRSVSETREGWGSRELHSDWESMFNKNRQPMPRGSCKKAGKKQPTSIAQQIETERGLDLSDLDLSSIEFSEREMAALSGLTPALSRRLQQQLLAHLPPAAARSLRRTLSLHAAPAPTSRHKTTRSHSASKSDESHNNDLLDELTAGEVKLSRTFTPKLEETTTHNINNTDGVNNDTTELKGVQRRFLRGHSAKSIDDNTSTEHTPEKYNSVTGNSTEITTKNYIEDLITKNETEENINSGVAKDLTTSQVSQFCTLPRLKRNTTISRDSTSPLSINDSTGNDFSSKLSLDKEQNQLRGSSIRNTADRPLLSKYLIPERNLSLDESYCSDSGSILSEPSYIAAYGTSSIGSLSNSGFRRHSLRLTGDQPRKRISRFLRSDFFDTPPDENLYTKHKKEKELETQKILKEIREKKIRSLESPKSPLDGSEASLPCKEESAYLRKCLSPVNNLISKERSRSSTPFFPILDNIKESNLDTSLTIIDTKKDTETKKDYKKTVKNEKPQNKESKMTRPKSYPIKKIDSFDETNNTTPYDKIEFKDRENEERKLPKESKLARPKSYPASTQLSEKNYNSRNGKKDELQNSTTLREDKSINDCKNDVEVSFSVTLPKRKTNTTSKSDSPRNKDLSEQKTEIKTEVAPTLVLKKYKVINEDKTAIDKNCTSNDNEPVAIESAKKINSLSENCLNETDIKISNIESNNQKTIKKKTNRKVSSKSKLTPTNIQEATDGNNLEDKKVVKKIKEKPIDDNSKSITTMKKKSVLQSISHKLEKFASTKSSSPEKSSQNSTSTRESKKECSKLNRMQREQSVPVNTEPPTESNLIKRAVTVTNVAVLESQNKTTVSKVLGLFKKFDPKEKTVKLTADSSESDNININKKKPIDQQKEKMDLGNEKEKPKRPTSLLLNGLGRKNKYCKAASDSASVASLEIDDLPVLKKDSEPKNVKNTLKLDFSRLPRVKKIVPTNPVIEPQIMDTSSCDKEIEIKEEFVKNGSTSIGKSKLDLTDENSRSRSRSQSIYSNSDVKSEHSADLKISDSFTGNSVRPMRNNESTSPEKDDIVDRIRRKSFYSRFNEKKQRRKSSLVGPGATEYDPVARLHSQPTETKLDVFPTSPSTYDLSPGFSIASDLSPSTDRYRSLLADLPSSRGSSRYEGFNDKIDTYRSLDRNDFKKISSGKIYLDSDHPGSFGTHRYARTKSLLENSIGLEDQGVNHLRDPIKYSRTNSLFTPGNYATYRPKRTRNSAIILKESEKEPSPENILDKIRNRKISIRVTRKQDPEDSLPRSNVPSKSEGDCAECSEKTD